MAFPDVLSLARGAAPARSDRPVIYPIACGRSRFAGRVPSALSGTSLPAAGLYRYISSGARNLLRHLAFFGLETKLSLSGDPKQGQPQNPGRLRPFALIAALGIVYGDIGTSPLYVFQAIAKINNGHFDETSALGSLSLIFWTLIIVVSLKYALVVMRADNRGEGGILALMSLTRAKWRGRNRYLIACGLIGAALLYGGGMITPAISVLSAVEGLKLASQDFARYTMPIAAVILLLLFVIQRLGTAAVGRAL